MPLITDDEIIYSAFAMDPLDAEPEPVQTITEDQLRDHTQSHLFWDVFQEVYGRRFYYQKDSRALLSMTSEEFDSWVSDLYYKANAYAASRFYAPMLPHMVYFYTGEQPA